MGLTRIVENGQSEYISIKKVAAKRILIIVHFIQFIHQHHKVINK